MLGFVLGFCAGFVRAWGKESFFLPRVQHAVYTGFMLGASCRSFAFRVPGLGFRTLGWRIYGSVFRVLRAV